MLVNGRRTAMRLHAGVREVPGLTIVDLSGNIDGFGDKVLESAYTQAIKRGPDAILLDFSDVSYINSKGIALLITLLIRARESGRRLLATGLSDHYLEIFEITRLSDYIPVVPGEAAARAAVMEWAERYTEGTRDTRGQDREAHRKG